MKLVAAIGLTVNVVAVFLMLLVLLNIQEKSDQISHLPRQMEEALVNQTILLLAMFAMNAYINWIFMVNTSL